MRVRYFTQDENGKTRYETYPAFGKSAPHYTDEIPEGFEYLFEWYYEISSRLQRTQDGGVIPIPPSEFVAWQKWTRNIVYLWEREVLAAMDLAFCREMGEELKAYHERMSPPSPKRKK